jgi:Tol biopolymer transport system component
MSVLACALVAVSLTACERVSVSSDEEQANGDTFVGSISRDGRYVAFESAATNLVPNDSPGDGIFLRDRTAGETVAVSPTGAGTAAGTDPAISANGRFVAFLSFEDSIVSGDTNNETDVFVWERETGATTRANLNSAGEQANGLTESLSISRNGRFVAFASRATNLVAGDDNGIQDVFVRDRVAGTTVRIPASVTNEAPLQPDGSTYFGLTAPVISLDGTHVAFASLRYVNTGGHLIARNGTDIYVHDLNTGTTQRVSDGAERGLASYGAALTRDGTRVAFASSADDLVGGDDNEHRDVFVRDIETGGTVRLPAESTGEPAVIAIDGPTLSGSGRQLGFLSIDIVNGVTIGANVYVHDFQTGQTHRITRNSNPAPLQGDNTAPRMSPRGDLVVFSSSNTNLVPNDTNNAFDLFVAPVPR